MKTDIEIAESVKLKPIAEIAEKLGLSKGYELYGSEKAKITEKPRKQKGKLILVTAMNPTPLGEGKTTVSIGLCDALGRIGKNASLALREPSLGPVFGLKGGATGGGYSQIAPMADINLHFTGDLHAITSANNLLSALIDNELYQNDCKIADAKNITWKRCMDMNDRALRSIVVGAGGKTNGVMREDGFDITAASEIMAVLCLAKDENDLRRRLERIEIGYDREGKALTAKDLSANGAMAILLKDAIKPNLVQTLGGMPAIVHGGPFANIAHGCNSVIATRTALGLSDYVVTEAGFGADLGAEKFYDIKCRTAGFNPSAAVLVVTVKSLKYNGGMKENFTKQDLGALNAGLCNMQKHIENLQNVFGQKVVVAINQYATDTDAEIEAVKKACPKGVEAIVCEGFAKGGEGVEELAYKVCELCAQPEKKLQFAYQDNESVKDKIFKVASRVYGASDVEYTKEALDNLEKMGSLAEGMAVCIAKTQYSLSDDPKRLGRPENFTLHVRSLKKRAGAGFIVVQAGDVMLMPGLSKSPAAVHMDIKENKITGLF